MKHMVMLSCCLAVAGCKQAPQVQMESGYEVMTVSPSDRVLSSTYSATIRGRQDIEIYPQVSGTLTKVCVTEGQRVKNGQALFIIDQVPYEAALQTALANVEAAKATLATAQLTYDSKRELYSQNVVSEFDLSTAKNSLLAAKAQLAQVKAQEVNARNNLSETVVKSPADGVVGTLPDVYKRQTSAFDFPRGEKSEPPLPPPIGNVVSEFLNVCSKARNLRILRFTEAWKRIPPLYGPIALLC